MREVSSSRCGVGVGPTFFRRFANMIRVNRFADSPVNTGVGLISIATIPFLFVFSSFLEIFAISLPSEGITAADAREYGGELFAVGFYRLDGDVEAGDIRGFGT